MKNMIRIRNSVILVLCITIIFLGIGFIVLSIDLKNKKDEVHSFDVSFVNVLKASSVKGSSIEPSGSAEITSDGKEVFMKFNLNATHDEVSFIATIENQGTLPAEIVDIIQSPNYQDSKINKLIYPITITLSDVKGKIINPGDKIDLKVVVYYNPSTSQVTAKNFDYRIGLITKSHQ